MKSLEQLLNKLYEYLQSFLVSLMAAILSMPIGDWFVAFIGGVFQIIVTITGAVLSFLVIEHLKKRSNGKN